MKKKLRKLSAIQLPICAFMLLVGFVAVAALHPSASTLGAFALVPVAFGMIGATSDLSKTLKCTSAISTAFTIAKFGADDDTADVATGATDYYLGVFQHTTKTAGDEIEIMIDGISFVVLGGGVTRGDTITSDSNAKGVKAVYGDNKLGYAMASGVSGDIIPVDLEQHAVSTNMGIDGLHLKGLLRVTYDFAVLGGVVGDIHLGQYLPAKAIITRGFGDIITAFVSTSNDGTIALKAEGAGDLLAAVDADTLSGRFELIPLGTAAAMVKTTVQREIILTVGTHAITAGKAVFFLEYMISD